MKDELIIICPELAPGAGGLADYTLRVVEHWPTGMRLRFILPESAPAAAERNVQFVQRSAKELLSALPATGGKVLVQYSAYGFDPFGHPRWLLRALIEWKRRSGGVLVLMLHEIWTFWPVLNKNYVVQQLHRRDLRTLLGLSDAVFTSTASQADHLHKLSPDPRAEVLPVGSNIRVPEGATSERAAGVAVLFGLQATRIRTLEKMGGELRQLAGDCRLVKIITAGSGVVGDDKERELLLELQLRDGFEQRGALAEADISQLLLQAEFGVSAQDKLSLTKSGTFMAFAAHGLNIISPYGAPSADEPLCWVTAPAELLGGVAPAVLQERSRLLQSWQKRTASWPHIAKQFARALRLEDANKAASTAAVP